MQQVRLCEPFIFFRNNGLPHHSWRTTQYRSFSPALFGVGSFRGTSKLHLHEKRQIFPVSTWQWSYMLTKKDYLLCSFTVPSVTTGTNVVITSTWTLCFWFDCWKKTIKALAEWKAFPCPRGFWCCLSFILLHFPVQCELGASWARSAMPAAQKNHF